MWCEVPPLSLLLTIRPLMVMGKTTVTLGSGVGPRVSFPGLIYDTRHIRHFKFWLILDDSQAFVKSRLRLNYDLPFCVISFAPQKILSGWTSFVHTSYPSYPTRYKAHFHMNELLWKNTMHQGKHCDQVEIQVDQTVTLMVSDPATTVTRHCGIIPSRSAAASEHWPLEKAKKESIL